MQIQIHVKLQYLQVGLSKEEVIEHIIVAILGHKIGALGRAIRNICVRI